MSQTPVRMSDRPGPRAYIGGVDVLSDAVAAMRTGLPHSSRTEFHAPWATFFPPQDGAGFHVVLQGACWLIPSRGEPVRLGVGDVVFLPRELGHGLADSPTARPGPEFCSPPGSGPATTLLCGAYWFDHSRVHPLMAELPEVMHLPAHVGRRSSLRGALELLGRELVDAPLPGAAGVVPALLDVLLLYILRAWHEESGGAAGWAAALRDPAVAAALRAVHGDPAHPWTVQSLSARAGLSRSAFAQRFTALVGSPPMAYLTWWRMVTAARLLRDTDLLLRTVAERAGYTSEYAFAKAFKRRFGAAPGRYRERPREHESENFTRLDGNFPPSEAILG